MNNFIGFILPVVVAALTNLLYEKFQQFVSLLQKLPPAITRIAVATLSFGLTLAAAKLQVVLSSADPTTLGQGDVAALASAALAYIFHLGDQAKKA